jgi:hypothetical protein
MQRRGEDWYCSPCFVRPQACAACGNKRQVAFRDRHGQPRCGDCPDQDPGSPLAALIQIINLDRPRPEQRDGEDGDHLHGHQDRPCAEAGLDTARNTRTAHR